MLFSERHFDPLVHVCVVDHSVATQASPFLVELGCQIKQNKKEKTNKQKNNNNLNILWVIIFQTML